MASGPEPVHSFKRRSTLCWITIRYPINPLLVPCDTAFCPRGVFAAHGRKAIYEASTDLWCGLFGVLEERCKTPSVVNEAEVSLSIFLFGQWPWVAFKGQSRTKLATWTMESISRRRWIPAPASAGSDYTRSGLSYKSFLDQKESRKKGRFVNSHACGRPPSWDLHRTLLQ